jgi:hypothetical protein
MALEKKTLSFALLKGVDEKSSGSAREPDALTVAKNVDFGKRGEIKKRGGFIHDDNMTRTKFGGGDISSGVAISQYGDETLILDGKNMYSWIKEGAGGQGLLDRGTYVPCTVKNEFKNVQTDKRQGNCQIAEKNGVRVYVWEEYEFEGTTYKTFVDIEHIASGSRLIETTEISSTAIVIDGPGGGGTAADTTTLYKQAQPQCAVIGNYVFIVYQESGNMRYRSVNCTSITSAAAITSEADLLNASAAPVTIDTTYPVYQIDKFLGVTHSDAIVFAYYAGSNTMKVQYLTASGATLSMPNDSIDVGGVGRQVYFAPYAKDSAGVPNGIFLKCLNDVDDAGEYSIIVGYTVDDSSTYKLGLTAIKDSLAAKVNYALQNTLADGSSSGSVHLLRGTAGSVTDEGAISVFVEMWSPTTDTGTQGTIVPEHFVRHYTLTGRGSTTIGTTSNVVAFNTSITSDFFRYNGNIYCVLSQVNDNSLYIDYDAITPSGNSRGLNNNSALVNLEGEIIGALRTGSAPLCLTSDYLTNNPSDFDSGRENRRLLFGAQRVTSRETSTVFVFGASRHYGYAFHDPGVYGPGDYPDNIFGVSLFEVDFDPARKLASVDIENAWLGSGGFIHNYDGNEVVENNFLNYPAIKKVDEATRATAAEGFSDSKVIKYCCIYSWTDAKGNLHQSMPSEMVEKTVTPGKVAGHGTITGGSGYSAAVGVAVGTTGSGTGCTVTTTVSAGAITDITIVNPGTGYSNGDSLTIPDGTSGAFVAVVSGKSIIQVQAYVPSLTRKKDLTVKLYRTDHASDTFYFVADIPVPNRTAATSSIVTYNDLPRDESAITSRPILYTNDLPGTGFAGCCTDLVRHQNKLIAAGTDDSAYASSVIREGVAPGFPLLNHSISLTGDPGKITAVESNLDHLLVFTNNDGYYVSGPGPDILGQGLYGEPRLFARGHGAVDGAAHTDSPLGVFYQTPRGIHLIGRDLSIAYIGAQVEDTVGAKSAVSMTRRDSENDVRIMLQAASPGSSGSDVYCIFNYYYKQWCTYEVAYTSSAHQVGEIYDGSNFQRLTADGRQFTQSATVYQDRNSAGSALVNYNMQIDTGYISPTGLMKKDRVYRYMYLGTYIAAHGAEVEVYNDYDDSDASQTNSVNLTGAPTGLYLYRTHLTKQKSRGVKLSLVITGSTAGANIEGFALEVGLRPDMTTFKTIESRTL